VKPNNYILGFLPPLIVISTVLLVLLTGCVADAQVVRISKGEASTLSRFVGIGGEYCQITTTRGVTITEADREAARTYCAPDSERLIELLRNGEL
jgi:hypothetical protein